MTRLSMTHIFRPLFFHNIHVLCNPTVALHACIFRGIRGSWDKCNHNMVFHIQYMVISSVARQKPLTPPPNKSMDVKPLVTAALKDIGKKRGVVGSMRQYSRRLGVFQEAYVCIYGEGLKLFVHALCRWPFR